MPLDCKIAGYSSGTVAEVDGTLYRAVRVTNRPCDYWVLDQHMLSGLSGTMAAGITANSTIYVFRWVDTTRLAVVHDVTMTGLSNNAAFAAGFGNLRMFFSRGWTVAASGGASIIPLTNQNKLRTRMSSSLDLQVLISTTGALTSGSPPVDLTELALLPFAAPIATSQNIVRTTKLIGTGGLYAHPVVLAFNEGLRLTATVPATGTWQFGITVGWTELAPATF